MPANIYRTKLLNAILYFAKNTKHLNKTKISKLLYFLDFTHFKQTGYPCLGLKYYSFKQGPVPKEFWVEIKDGNVPDDFKKQLALIHRTDEANPKYRELEFKALASPDMSVFTPREQDILEQLAFIFKDTRTKQISEVSHLSNQPWDITLKKHGENQIIDYCLAIDKESNLNLEEANEALKEHFEAVNNLKLNPTP